METVCVFLVNVFHYIQLQLLFLLNNNTGIYQLICLLLIKTSIWAQQTVFELSCDCDESVL